MKYSIILIGLLLINLSACTNFLDIPSKTTLTTDSFFQTQGDFEKAVNGAYEPLRDLFKISAWQMGEMHSDNTRYMFNPDNRGWLGPENIADFIYEASNPEVADKYRGDFLIIARANQVLALIDKVNFDASVKDNLKGQAYFLRAFSYFDLVQYFGKVPLHLAPATSLSDVALPLSSVDSVYKQIKADALKASALLPLKSKQEKGRATSGAAKTLLGNVYIVLKEYARAEAVLQEVVDSKEYELLGNYAALYSTSNKNNAESVFEIQYLEGAGGYASNFIYSFLPAPITVEELKTLMTKYGASPANLQAITQEAYNVPSPEMIAAYEVGDRRKDASIGYGVAKGVSYPFVLKYLHPHANVRVTDDNWPVYRYAEVLLLLSEAINEQPERQTTDALFILNKVHAHPRTGLSDITATDRNQLRNFIMNERRVELAFENKRWLDLVRTGKAVETITAYGKKIKAEPQKYYFPAKIAPVPAAFVDIRTTFPLPASEALLSPYF